MYNFLMSVHVAACLLLILVVLLQAGRGAGLSVFGGSGGDMLATPSGTSFMKQLTGWIAITFAVTSLLLTLLSGRAGMRSVTNYVTFPKSPPGAQAPAAQGAASAPKTAGTQPSTPAVASGKALAQPAASSPSAPPAAGKQ